METVGQILSIGRNSKKLSISNIAIELKISKSIIIDLENDNIKNNPDIIFNIGHLRSYSNFLELDTDTIIKKFKDQVSFNVKEEKKNITPIVENNFFKIEKFFAASIILVIFTSFYFLFVDQNDNEINFALIPDIPESLEPIVEKANTFDNLSQNSDIKKSDLINNSSAIASIEFDENVTTVATLKMLNPTWLQLRDEENNIVLSKLMDKDEEFSYELKLNYNITAGNAGNILVLIDDEVRGKIGKYGDILDSFVLYKDFTN
jgi:transcriptional regulator with XRE-family HTH domain